MSTARQLRRAIGSRKQRKADATWTLGLHKRKRDPQSNNSVKLECKAANLAAEALAKEAARLAALEAKP